MRMSVAAGGGTGLRFQDSQRPARRESRPTVRVASVFIRFRRDNRVVRGRGLFSPAIHSSALLSGFGSWRIWGGGPLTWFPLDWSRLSRDAIFVAFVRGAAVRIGFTVEDSRTVKSILRERQLLA